MSLFRSREWWAVNLNENEMYDSQCLFTITLGDDKFESILLGNHKGILRLFSPNSEILEGVSSYKPSHLLLEVQLGSPILQINEGSLVSGSPNRYLAILHPRLFSVYALKKKESKETHIGDQMEIELAYQHILRHSAHSFVLGPFGGVGARNFACIQSLDGLLSFYEQESFAFQVYLPTFLLPSTFSYLEKTDSFLFLNGLLILECYTYEALASAGHSNDKKILKTWEYNLGESVLDINTVAKNGLIIVILSERNLYGLNENGKMVFMRRLESKPVAICSYLTEESKNLMIIMATEGQFVNVYEEVNLKWSMKVDFIPVCIKRVFISSLPGGIALLSEDGLLQVVYIGTHPSVYLIPQLVQPEINIQKAQSQLQVFQRKIAENEVVDLKTAELVKVSLKINKTTGIENNTRSCGMILTITAHCLINKIQILFIVEPPLAVKKGSMTIFDFCEETSIENTVCAEDSCFVSSLTVQIVVTYITSEGVTTSIQKSGALPLDLVVSETAPVKESLHKITVTSNRPVCGVNQLFREFTSEHTSANAMGLRFNSGEVVSILAAKSSQRYRVQSDSLAAITIILQVLLERLKIHFEKEPDFNGTYSAPLPLDQFFEKIVLHQSLIRKRSSLEENLSKQTSQYIAIQKKVLAKLQDATPKSASNLYVLLKDTTKMIENSIDELEKTEKDLLFSRSCLRSLLRLMTILLQLMPIRKEDLRILKVAFNPHVQDTDDQGWLEVQEAALSFLLRTILARSAKDQQKPTDVLLEPLMDTSKLSKHFTSVIERITKGTYLFERNDYEGKKGDVTVMTSMYIHFTGGPQEKPKEVTFNHFDKRHSSNGGSVKILIISEPLVTIQAAYGSDESLFDDAIPISTKFLSGDTKVQKDSPRSKTQDGTAGLTLVREDEEEKEAKAETGSEKEEIAGSRTQQSASEMAEPERTEEEDDYEGIWDVKVLEMKI